MPVGPPARPLARRETNLRSRAPAWRRPSASQASTSRRRSPARDRRPPLRLFGGEHFAQNLVEFVQRRGVALAAQLEYEPIIRRSELGEKPLRQVLHHLFLPGGETTTLLSLGHATA